MNNQRDKVGSFLKNVIKIPAGIELLLGLDGNILFSDPYTEEDIIYYVYLTYQDKHEKLIYGVKISLLEQPQKAYENINAAILEFKGKIDALAR